MSFSDKKLIKGEVSDFRKELEKIQNRNKSTMSEVQCFETMHQLWNTKPARL